MIEEKVLELYRDKFLVLECQSNMIEMYQVKMFYYQQITGIHPFRFSMSQNKSFLYYKLDNTSNLTELIKSGVSKYELNRVLDQIKTITQLGQQYLLSEDNFILNPNWIFVKKEQKEVKVDLIYVPFKDDIKHEYKTYKEKFIGLLSKTFNELNEMDGFYYFARYYQELQEGGETSSIVSLLSDYLTTYEKCLVKGRNM